MEGGAGGGRRRWSCRWKEEEEDVENAFVNRLMEVNQEYCLIKVIMARLVIVTMVMVVMVVIARCGGDSDGGGGGNGGKDDCDGDAGDGNSELMVLVVIVDVIWW